MGLKFSHRVCNTKQLNCEAAGTTSTFLRFLATFGNAVNSGLNGSCVVGMGLKEGFGIGIGIGPGVKSGKTIMGAFVGKSGGGFVGNVAGIVEVVTTGPGVADVKAGGAGFVGMIFAGIDVVPLGGLVRFGGLVGGGVNSGWFGSNVVDDTTGSVVVGNNTVLHCCATKLSGIVSQFSHTKHWSCAEAVNGKLISY